MPLSVVRKPKKRHSSNMIADLKKENADAQKQEFGRPSQQPSLRCQTHALFCLRTRFVDKKVVN